jgi:Ca2+-binding EF-hand superfamily protein
MLFSMHGEVDNSVGFNDLESQECDNHFNRVDSDSDRNGRIEESDLLSALQRAGVNANGKAVKTLMKSADADKDGTIDREEWKKMCYVGRSSRLIVSDSNGRSTLSNDD